MITILLYSIFLIVVGVVINALIGGNKKEQNEVVVKNKNLNLKIKLASSPRTKLVAERELYGFKTVQHIKKVKLSLLMMPFVFVVVGMLVTRYPGFSYTVFGVVLGVVPIFILCSVGISVVLTIMTKIYFFCNQKLTSTEKKVLKEDLKEREEYQDV